MRHWILKAISYLVIFFFAWTSGGLFNVAYAAYNETQKPPVNQKQQQRPEEKFQKAIEDIKSIIIDSKTATFENRKSKLKTKRDEIDSSDNEIKSQFAATEKKLKDAGLPKEILQRHYNFVKHYEDNLKELKANLDAADKTKTKTEFDTQLQKVQKHLEKVAPPRKHKALDPNKLPHRISDIKRKEPRTKPEEFQKDKKQTATAVIPVQTLSPAYAGGIQENLNNFVIPAKAGIQDTINNNKPLLFAANGPLTGFVEKLPKFEKQQSLPEPIILALAHDTPTSADLTETIDVQLTPAIKAKAAELGYSPVKIYNWVRNNVEYVPTYGSIQGADMCLQTKQGNDFDIASLLIALLRASGIHARYVYGTIELPIDKVMNWVGGFTNANAALNFIASGGTPVAALISGGKISAARMEHVWVEAYVKYYPLRGAKHETGQGDSWIPLDASYKQYIYKPGMDMYAQMTFNADQFLQEYVTDTRDIMAYQDYGIRLVDYIDNNYPDASIEDVFGAGDIKLARTIIKQEFSYLLGTLPYTKFVKTLNFSSIPSTYKQNITIQIAGNEFDDANGLSYSGVLNDLASKRITISFEPATSNDESLAAQYGGNILSVPAYLLNVKPVLKINGNVVAAGNPIGLGIDQNIIILFSGNEGTIDRIQHTISAGEYAAIVIQSGETSISITADNMSTLIENTKNVNVPGITLDDVLGQLLHAIGISYFQKLSFENEIYAKTIQLLSIHKPSEVMVTRGVNISYLFGLPQSVSESGVVVDVKRNVNAACSLTGDKERVRAFMILSGLSSSAWEHKILEAFFDVPSVSAVRLLKKASGQGSPIYTISNANITTLLPQLQVSEEVKTDITNAVNAGKKVLISLNNVTLNNWAGVGYIIIDPANGDAVYMINGGLSGGQTSNALSLCFTRPDVKDCVETYYIRTYAVAIARAYIGTPYFWAGALPEPGFDCSGFVYYIFSLMNIFLSGNPYAVNDRTGRPYGLTAATEYDYCWVNDWLRPWGERLYGDIMWKSDLKHVGIYAGINTIEWPLNTGKQYVGETVVHASGKPCKVDNECVPNTPCVLGNPPCGKFRRVIESPFNIFGGSIREMVGRPR